MTKEEAFQALDSMTADSAMSCCDSAPISHEAIVAAKKFVEEFIDSGGEVSEVEDGGAGDVDIYPKQHGTAYFLICVRLSCMYFAYIDEFDIRITGEDGSPEFLANLYKLIKLAAKESQ